MKTVLKIIAAVIVLIIVAIGALIATFDPNDYKTQITEAVEQQTGRQLTITGDISLSFFPWIGLELGRLSLSNAKGFSESEFARIEQLDIKLKLLPLLSRHIEIDKIRLHGLFVSLETRKDGKTNWQDMAQSSAEAAPPSAKPDLAETGDPAFAGLLINGVELVDANIVWHDDSAGMHTKISDLNLTVGEIQFDQWLPLSFSAHINNNAPKLDTRVTIETRLKMNRQLTTLDIKQLKLSTLGLELLAEMTVADLDKTPTAKGRLTLSDTDLRPLAKQFAIALPVSANPDRFSKFGFSLQLDANAQAAKLDDLQLRLDDSTLTGYVHISDVAKQSLRYQLKLDQIDVDSYLPPVVESATPPATIEPEADVEIALPVEMLRQLDIDGELQIASLSVKQIAITELRLVSKARDGVITLAPISMKLLQGEANAELNLNVQKNTRYGISLTANNIVLESVVNPLLSDLLEGEDLTMHGGTANLSLNVNTQGQWLSELKRAARGNLSLDASKASVSGVDIEYFVRNSVANYLAEKKINVRPEWRGVYRPGEKTAFRSLLLTAVIADGKIVNDRLAIDASKIKVAGTGVIDLMANTIDEKMTVTLLKSQEAGTENKIIAQPVPVRVHGPFTALQYTVDKSWLATAVGAQIKEKAKAKVEEKTEQKVQEQKQKLEEKVKDKLKGLFR